MSTKKDHPKNDLARVVALAGLGESSLRQFGEELGQLAEQLEAAFVDTAAQPGFGAERAQVGIGELRADEARERTHTRLWLDGAPQLHGDWLRVPPVRGAKDEAPALWPGEALPERAAPKPPEAGAPDVLPLAFDDATELAQRIACKELTWKEALEGFMQPLLGVRQPKIESEEQPPAIDAWNALIDARWPRREPAQGDLGGVPLVVKTNIASEGFETNCASHALAGWRAPYTATAVRRLVARGAIPFAAANMDEFAMGSSGETSAFGVTVNPWSRAKALAPGGSSSGSAAAVAAGLTPLALGSDAGGSIRQPAAFCGVCGLRPSAGRVSRFGLVAFSSSFDTIGPLARSARDLALAFDAMVGADPRDVTTTNQPGLPLVANGWRGLVVGVPRRLLEECQLEPAVAASFEASLLEIEGLGATLVDIELGGASGRPDAALSAYHIISCAEAASNLARLDGMRFGPSAGPPAELSFKSARRSLREASFGSEVKRRLLIGTFSLARAGAPKLFERARAARQATTLEFQVAFQTAAVIAMPTSPTCAFPLGARLDDPMAMYRADLLTVPASLAGVAALSIPGPRLKSPLPIGLQLIAPQLADERLLALATLLQREHPHHLERPLATPKTQP